MSLVHCSFRKISNFLSVIPVVHVPVAKTHRHKLSKWSMEIPTRNIIPNPNTNRILMDAPDYSFLDKRPIPYNSGQFKRVCLQQEYTKKILQLTSEVKFAQNRYKELQKEKLEKEQNILNRKLLKKGGVIKEEAKK